MSRGRQVLVVVGGLVLVGAAVYLAYRSRPQQRFQLGQVAGLAWLPAEAGLVGSVDLAALRQQAWLLEMMRRATGEVKEAPDYQAFVEATGFDYSRDLDHFWLGVFGSSEQPRLTGVAEGRFARVKILDYARRQGAVPRRHQNIDIYEVPPAPPHSPPRSSRAPAEEPSGRGFAFAFLDDSHLAFASDAERVAMIVDCWLGKSPAVLADGARRAELERLAAGKQAWVVDEPAKWKPPFFHAAESGQPLAAIVVKIALGLRVSGQGVELAGEARCREPAQAERLRDNLNAMVLLGRMALSRQRNENAQALAQALADLTLTQQGDTVVARVLVPPDKLAALFGVPASAGSAR